MKVAVTDCTFENLDPERAILEPLGFDLVGPAAKAEGALVALVADADAVITQFAPVTADVIKAMTRAKVIVRYGIGVDNVDLEAARRPEENLPVCNIPDYCIDEVADHTLALDARPDPANFPPTTTQAFMLGNLGNRHRPLSAMHALKRAHRRRRGLRSASGARWPRGSRRSSAASWCPTPPFQRKRSSQAGCIAAPLEELLADS